MKLTEKTKLYVLPDGKFITLADIWRTEREQILETQELLDKIMESFIMWNEKYGINDQAFAERVVTLLGSKYLEKSKEVEEEQNSID